MATEIAELKTLREIAKERGVAVHRLVYLLLSRRIDPARYVGGVRVYGPREIAAIDRALQESAHSPVSHRADFENRITTATETR